jgi:Tol biopolymer transport system component
VKLALSLAALVVALVGARSSESSLVRSANAKPSSFRILYSSDWSGTTQIYAVDPSGRSPTGQLTFGSAGGVAPSPSPDGRRLAFERLAGDGLGLYVSALNGNDRRLVARLNASDTTAVWAPDSSRLAYTSTDGIHVVDADGTHDQHLSGSAKGDADPAWSPDGRVLTACRGNGLLVVFRGGSAKTLARGNDCFRNFLWSPSGKWIAYQNAKYVVSLVSPDGNQHRSIARALWPDWSPDGRRLEFDDYPNVGIYDVASRKVSTIKDVTFEGWSPGGKTIAVGIDLANKSVNDAIRIELVDPTTGAAVSRITDNGGQLVWSPDGRRFVFGTNLQDVDGITYGASDLQVGSVGTAPRTIVSAGGNYGGFVSDPMWIVAPPGMRFPHAVGRTLATTTKDELTTYAPDPVERIAADGGRVAYLSCGHIFVWKPADGSVVQTESVLSLGPRCDRPGYYTATGIYSLALAGARVAYGTVCCNNCKNWKLQERDVAPGSVSQTLGTGYTCGPSEDPAESGRHYSNPVGSGSLLVYTAWDTQFASGGRVQTTSTSILRAEPGGCPCPVLHTEPGPLIVDDLDAGRIVARGTNAVLLLDSDGNQLRSIPVAAAAAALSGDDLIVVANDKLLDYATADGSLVHSWPLPDIGTSPDCPVDLYYGCPDKYASAPLRLQDTARGLVAYTLNSDLHLLRLSDGKDAVIGPGSHARFMDAGLVYSLDNRLELIPYAELPLA